MNKDSVLAPLLGLIFPVAGFVLVGLYMKIIGVDFHPTYEAQQFTVDRIVMSYRCCA